MTQWLLIILEQIYEMQLHIADLHTYRYTHIQIYYRKSKYIVNKTQSRAADDINSDHIFVIICPISCIPYYSVGVEGNIVSCSIGT